MIREFMPIIFLILIVLTFYKVKSHYLLIIKILLNFLAITFDEIESVDI